MPTIIIDLDGTLCDSKHREQFALNGDWDNFHAHLAEDKPHYDVVTLIDLLSENDLVEMVGCTGRPEKWRQATERWLMNNGVYLDHILMRPNHDFSPDHELKVHMLSEWHKKSEPTEWRTIQERVSFILDDRDKVVEAWRSAGFSCWQVRQGTF